jgi:chromosomal replication initiation ATPase DnaA
MLKTELTKEQKELILDDPYFNLLIIKVMHKSNSFLDLDLEGLIISATCTSFKIHYTSVLSQSRAIPVAKARMIILYFMYHHRRYMNKTTEEIGLIFHLKHGAVINAAKKLPDYLKTDPEIKAVHNYIETLINIKYEQENSYRS